MIELPASIDIMQMYPNILEVPEIRVWCHPHKIGNSGDDYYLVFDTWKLALDFIKRHKESEDVPLLAFRGYEINLFDLQKPKEVKE